MTEFTSALDVAAHLRAGEVSARELVERCLSLVDERDGEINAVVWWDADDAVERAERADARLAAGTDDDLPPFLGVPLPVKDVTDVAGWPVSHGSRGAHDAPGTVTAPVVAELERAGFVLVGRTNTPEFGMITATENLRHGITRNPWDLGATPGGSSGGAAAAVAAGMFPIAHASDGGGSIRIPASCCGLVGLKPSRGRVVAGTIGWEGALTAGVVTHTVADTAAVLDVIGAEDPHGWSNAPRPERPFLREVGVEPPRLRVAVLRRAPMGPTVHPECLAAVDAAALALSEGGHEVVPCTFEARAEEFRGHFGRVVQASLARFDEVDWERAEPHNQAARARAAAVDSLDYVASVAAIQRWSRTFTQQWGGDFDLLVTPTLPFPPPPAGQVLAELAERSVSETVLASVSFTSMFNASGLPAISLPLHQATDSGLPIGVQLVAGPWQEALLLRVAAQLEVLLGWAERRAPIPG